MKFLIKKVESLEKRVKELKHENDKLERRSERKAVQQDRQAKGLVSNLISIKVEAENLHIKEDILQELRKLKDKVDILENKSGDYSRKLPHKMDQCQTVSPEHMAESKISSQSNLIFSQAKDKKQTGKIFKKSEVRSSEVLDLRQDQPPPSENHQQEEDKKLPEQLIELSPVLEKPVEHENKEQKKRDAITIMKDIARAKQQTEEEKATTPKKIEKESIGNLNNNDFGS